MTKHCIYCKTQIDENSVVDVCRRCGVGVWGEKMFAAILQNMSQAKEAGDLFQGTVTHSPSPNKPKQVLSKNDFVEKSLGEKPSSDVFSEDNEVFAP
nr:hypothetical protein [uncultured archaeon]